MHPRDYIIISQNKQDNSRLRTILDYHPPKVCCQHCYKNYRTSQLTPQSSRKFTSQADQKP